MKKVFLSVALLGGVDKQLLHDQKQKAENECYLYTCR